MILLQDNYQNKEELFILQKNKNNENQKML